MLCQVQYVEAFNIIKLVKEDATPMVSPWGMETGTLNLAFLISKAGIQMQWAPMILPWICMQTSSVYWFINWEFLTHQPLQQLQKKLTTFGIPYLGLLIGSCKKRQEDGTNSVNLLLCLRQPSDWFGVLSGFCKVFYSLALKHFILYLKLFYPFAPSPKRLIFKM